MELPCKTCGERKPEVAFAKRQWKNCRTAGKQGQCLACSDSDPDKPTEGPKRTAEEAWAHFEAAESDGAVDGGVHRKKSVRLRVARPSADAEARATLCATPAVQQSFAHSANAERSASSRHGRARERGLHGALRRGGRVDDPPRSAANEPSRARTGADLMPI